MVIMSEAAWLPEKQTIMKTIFVRPATFKLKISISKPWNIRKLNCYQTRKKSFTTQSKIEVMERYSKGIAECWKNQIKWKVWKIQKLVTSKGNPLKKWAVFPLLCKENILRFCTERLNNKAKSNKISWQITIL